MQQLDPRIVRVGIEVDGKLKIYEDLNIVASGTKYANSNQNECTVKITNIARDTRNYILSETSPFNKNRTPKRLIIEAGRESYGASRIFVGDITNASVGQPPDIELSIKALTGNHQKGNIVSRTGASQTSLQNLSQMVATDIGATLDFQAQNKNIANYSFNGPAVKQIEKLSEAGLVDAYLDDGVLVVKDMNVPLSNRSRVLNKSSGMIGLPELTEQGIKVKFLLDNQTTLGGGLRIESDLNPSINGDYTIYKLSFEIANRTEPFYWIAEAKRT